MHLRNRSSAVTAFGAMTMPAAATTVTLTYNGGTANGTATITASPVVPVGGLGTYGAWGFNMTDTTLTLGDANGRFVAWCLDLSQWLSGGNFDITTSPFSNTFAINIARVQSVFDANYASLTLSSPTQAAGFQVALWNAIYDDDWLASGGVFAVAAGGGVQAQADAYLRAASLFSGPSRYDLTFLENTNPDLRIGQNLVTATPVPLPAAGLLLLATLGGLGLMRRRHRMI